VIWYKRLEAGTFSFPFAGDGAKEIDAWELGVFWKGSTLSKGRRRKRYSLPAVQGAWGKRRGSRIGSGGERSRIIF